MREQEFFADGVLNHANLWLGLANVNTKIYCTFFEQIETGLGRRGRRGGYQIKVILASEEATVGTYSHAVDTLSAKVISKNFIVKLKDDTPLLAIDFENLMLSTTFTTTGTSTGTTTVTTGTFGKVECVAENSNNQWLLGISAGSKCSHQLDALNDVLSECPANGHGTLVCTDVIHGNNKYQVLSDKGGGNKCSKTGAALTNVVREFSGPLNGMEPVITCASFTQLQVAATSLQECTKVAEVINAVFDAYLEGTFINCEVTTQTTTASTTVTSTSSTSTTISTTTLTSLTTTTANPGIPTLVKCDAGHVGVAAMGEHNNYAKVVCRKAPNVDFEQKLEYAASISAAPGYGAVKTAMAPTTDDVAVYKTSALLVTHLVNAEVQVSLGGFSAKSPKLTSAVHAATMVSGVLRSLVVRHDESDCFPSQSGCGGSPTVAASFQLREGVTFSTNVPDSKLTVVVTPSKGGVTPISKAFTCKGKSICHVSIPLPKTNFLDKLQGGEQSLQISYILGEKPVGNPIATGKLANDVTWIPPPGTISSNVKDTVYTVLPSRDLYAGDQFTIEVRSKFNVYFKTAQVRVAVGSGLQIVGASAPTNAFLKAPIDRNANQAVVSLAGRKDGKSNAIQSAPTDELLLTLTIETDTGVRAGQAATIEIDKLSDLTDLNENGLEPAAVGVMETRYGVVTNNAGNVHFNVDERVGIFGDVGENKPNELFNTAIISGTAVEVPIVVTSVSKRGVQAVGNSNGATCHTQNSNVLNDGGSDGCTATMTGQESQGARQVDFVLEMRGMDDATIPFRVHTFEPGSIGFSVPRTTLKPYAGLYDESDQSCSTLQYQSTTAVATATFHDGSGDKVTKFDLTGYAKLVSTDTAVAKVDSMTITGVGTGTVTIQIQGKKEVLGTATVTVLEQSVANMLAVVGLDVAIVSELGTVAMASSGPYGHNKHVGVSIAAFETIKLSYEDDSMTVIASAVFEDNSRLQLSEETGLTLTTNNADAIGVATGSKVVVPFDPVQASGELLKVAWLPSGKCQKSSYAMSSYTSRNVTLEVSPPVAEEMLASSSNSFIVCSEDTATHTGADYPATTQLSVSLKFATRTVNNLHNDERTSYAVSDASMITVDDATGKVTANSNGRTGKATVNITFAGQSAYKVVEIEVTKLEKLVVSAAPYPVYTGSSSVAVSRLSQIGCTDMYQTTLLSFVVVLFNGATKSVNGDKVAIVFEGDVDNMKVSSGSARIVTPIEPGIQRVVAKFGNPTNNEVSSNRLKVTVDYSSIGVQSIDNLRLVANGRQTTTLQGIRNQQTGQLQVGVTLSDGRQYIAALSATGVPALPGLLEFASDTAGAIRMNSATGVARLDDNYHQAVKLTAKVCSSASNAVDASIDMYANLEPDGADVDVGARTGVPIPTRSTGDSFTVDVRVNTDGETLQSFNVLLAYDVDDLELVETTNAVPSNSGSAEFKPGASTGNTGLESICSKARLGNACAVAVASITNSKVTGTAETIFRVKFSVKAGAAATTLISGVIEQLLDTSSGGGETIGTKRAVFDAGKVTMQIADGQRRNRRAGGANGNVTAFGTSTLQVVDRQPRGSVIDDLVLLKGDANCDGVFDLKDPAFILDFASARAGDFKTTLGATMEGLVADCQAKLGLVSTDFAFMDPDSNTEVTLLDLTYMLDILAGNFYFMRVMLPPDNVCAATFTVQMATAQGERVPTGTKVFLDFATSPGSSNPELVSAMTGNLGHITNNKGTAALSGALIEAAATNDPTIFVVELGAISDISNTGVSAIQVSSTADANPSWKFFSGKPTTGFATSEYKASLTYSKEILSARTDLELKNGYNAAAHVSRSIGGDCSTVPPTTSSTTTMSSTSTTTVSTTTTSTTTVSTTTTITTTVSTTTTITTITTTTTTTVTTDPDAPTTINVLTLPDDLTVPSLITTPTSPSVMVDPLTTTPMNEPAAAGSTTIQMDTTGYTVGAVIIVGVGTPFAEENMIAGFSSRRARRGGGGVILAYPLKYSHPAGTMIGVLVVVTVAPELCEGDVLGTVLFDDIANLFLLNDAQMESMGENARQEAARLVMEANIPIEVTCERTVITPEGIFIQLIGAPFSGSDLDSTAAAARLLKDQIDNKLFTVPIVDSGDGSTTALMVPGDFMVDALSITARPNVEQDNESGSGSGSGSGVGETDATAAAKEQREMFIIIATISVVLCMVLLCMMNFLLENRNPPKTTGTVHGSMSNMVVNAIGNSASGAGGDGADDPWRIYGAASPVTDGEFGAMADLLGAHGKGNRSRWSPNYGRAEDSAGYFDIRSALSGAQIGAMSPSGQAYLDINAARAASPLVAGRPNTAWGHGSEIEDGRRTAWDGAEPNQPPTSQSFQWETIQQQQEANMPQLHALERLKALCDDQFAKTQPGSQKAAALSATRTNLVNQIQSAQMAGAGGQHLNIGGSTNPLARGSPERDAAAMMSGGGSSYSPDVFNLAGPVSPTNHYHPVHSNLQSGVYSGQSNPIRAGGGAGGGVQHGGGYVTGEQQQQQHRQRQQQQLQQHSPNYRSSSAMAGWGEAQGALFNMAGMQGPSNTFASIPSPAMSPAMPASNSWGQPAEVQYPDVWPTLANSGVGNGGAGERSQRQVTFFNGQAGQTQEGARPRQSFVAGMTDLEDGIDVMRGVDLTNFEVHPSRSRTSPAAEVNSPGTNQHQQQHAAIQRGLSSRLGLPKPVRKQNSKRPKSVSPSSVGGSVMEDGWSATHTALTAGGGGFGGGGGWGDAAEPSIDEWTTLNHLQGNKQANSNDFM
jgi:hypothetical protein